VYQDGNLRSAVPVNSIHHVDEVIYEN